VDVVVAAHDLPGGEPLGSGDLAIARLPPSVVPTGSVTALGATIGRTLAAPMRAGEPLTDVRLVGPRLVDALRLGLVATPIRVADAAVAGLLRPGDRVDVLATPADPAAGETTGVIAADALVIAVPRPPSDGATPLDGALVLLATTPRVATALAGASTGDRLSLTLLGS
jgi:pilus assembly protein CpaB